MQFTEEQIIQAARSVYVERLQRGPSFFKLATKEKSIWYLILNNVVFQLGNRRKKICWWPTKTTLNGKNTIDLILASKNFQLTSLRKVEQETSTDIVQTLIELKRRLENESD